MKQMRKDKIIIDIECVKIIGKIKGINEKVELLMDRQTFYEWKDKINKEYYCANCGEQKVENKGDWCDDCNLPERSWIK